MSDPKDTKEAAPKVELKPVEANIKARLAELTNVSRIISNGINLILDVNIKGGHAAPVAEFTNWLTGFNTSVLSQIKTLEATLPKPKEDKKSIVPKAVDTLDPDVAHTVKPVEPAAKSSAVTPGLSKAK